MSEITSPSGPPLDRLREIIARLGDCMTDVSDVHSPDLQSIQEAIRVASEGIESVDQPNPGPHKTLDQSAPESSQSFAKLILENSPDAIFVLQDFVCVSCNPAARQLLRCDEEAICQGNFLSRFAGVFDVEENWTDTVIEQLSRLDHIEFEVQRNDSPTWCDLSLRRVESNGKRHVLAVAHDISKRKHAELELIRNRNFLQNTLNAVPEPVSVKSSNLDIILVNDSFCETHDVRREDVVGKPADVALRAVNPLESAYFEREVLATGMKQETIDTFVDTNEETFLLSTYHSAFHDDASNQPFVVAASRDVTMEIKRENRLRLLASVFENAQEGVAILNPKGEVCEANPEFIATAGTSHAKVLGNCLSTVVNCEPHHFSEIIELAQAGRPWFGNVKMINKRREEIACWLSLSPSKNVRGETTNLIAMFSDITQVEDTKRELRRQALHDNLTQLPNRRYYRKQIADLIASDVDGSVRFGVCFLDLDDFKIVNDTLGHDVGDQLLVDVSNRIKSMLGPECFMARFGGDEFALLIPEQKNEPLRAHSSSQAVVDALSKPFELESHEVHIGVSVGTTIYPDHATDVESLMRHADVAMYRAKEEGKNKVRFFSSELVEIVEMRQSMLNELRFAMENDELKVVYQPKLCLKTDRVAGCEALVRWTKSDGTVVPPNEFIPLAEDFGLIIDLGNTVLEAVCQQAGRWHDAGWLTGPIAVNLSPRQLKEPKFIERLMSIVKEARILPEWIELEITEDAVMEDKDRSLRIMHRIQKLGFSIAMDDFGTGYSSLSNIRDFPIRTLKIDTSFVKDLPDCSRAVAIAKTVLSLGHGLDLQVVAEGVETVEQAEFLRESGCDMVQGYLISHPMTCEEYVEFLRNLN